MFGCSFFKCCSNCFDYRSHSVLPIKLTCAFSSSLELSSNAILRVILLIFFQTPWMYQLSSTMDISIVRCTSAVVSGRNMVTSLPHWMITLWRIQWPFHNGSSVWHHSHHANISFRRHANRYSSTFHRLIPRSAVSNPLLSCASDCASTVGAREQTEFILTWPQRDWLNFIVNRYRDQWG